MRKLPKRWKVKSLGDVCSLIGGGTPSKKNDNFYKGEIYWATVRDMKKDIITQTEFRITEEAVKKSSTNIISAGNVVIATRVGLGKVCLVDEDTAINQDLRGIVPLDSDTLIVRFLFWWLKSIAHLIEKEGTGATVKGVKLPFVKSLQLPLPPLPEQKRIVSILDDVFAGISKAVANAEKNLANARELFESYLNNVFTQKGEGWKETILGNEIDLLTGFAFKSKGYTESHKSIRLLRGDNIIQGSFRWENVKRWPIADVNNYQQYYLEEHDVVIAMDRTWVKAGLKFAQVALNDLPCLLVQRVARLRAKKELNSSFLKYLIGSNPFTRYVLSIQTGTGVPHISGPQIKRFMFFRPPTSVQKNISIKLGELFKQTQQLEAIYQEKLTALAELKQSVLQKTFAGELTADAIRQQGKI